MKVEPHRKKQADRQKIKQLIKANLYSVLIRNGRPQPSHQVSKSHLGDPVPMLTDRWTVNSVQNV